MNFEQYSAAINDQLIEAELPILDADDMEYILNMYDISLDVNECAEYVITQRLDQQEG